MVTARVLKDTNGIFKGFKVNGHALFDKKGKDIVCAAVSILTINTVNSLEQFTDCDFTCKSDDGIEVVFHKQPDEKACLLMDSYLLGLEGISEEYSQYFRLMIEEV